MIEKGESITRAMSLLDAEEVDDKFLRQLREERASRIIKNKYRYYEPNGKCEEYIAEVGKGERFVVMFSAANGVGKTAVSANVVANIVFKNINPYFDYPLYNKWPYPKQGRIVSYPSNLEGVVGALKEWLPENKYKTRKRGKTYESLWEAEGGWKWDLMTTEQDPKEFEGPTLGWIWFDEIPPMSIYKACVSRLRKGGIIFISATPLEGSGWLYDHIVEAHTDEEDEQIAGLARGQRVNIEAGVESACFTKDVEILTRDGWISFDKISEDCRFASVDIESKTFRYLKPKALIKKTTTELVNVFGLSCTPDHEFPAIRDNGKISRVSAINLYRGNRLFYSAKQKEDKSSDFSPIKEIKPLVWAKLLGWYIAEGSCAGARCGYKIGKNQIYISQKTKIKELKSDLLATSLFWHERKGRDGCNDFWITDKRLYKAVSVLGGAKQKYIPQYVFSASEKYRRSILAGLILGDGDDRPGGRYRYRTASPRLADDVQQLGVSLGMASRISAQKYTERLFRGRIMPETTIYCVYLRENARNAYIGKKPKIRKVEEMDVFCVSVPDEYIIVRDGKIKVPLIAGNCKQHGVRGHLEHNDIEKMTAEYSEDEKQARVYGKFQHLAGLVFKTWSRKIHMINPFQISRRDFCVYEMLDPHPRNEDAVLWIAVNSKRQKFVVDELYLNPMNGIEELALAIKEKAEKYRIVRRLADPSAFNEDQHTQRSLATQLSDYGLNYIKATKFREAANKKIETELAYVQLPTGEVVKAPGFYVFNSLKRLPWEMEHWRWDEWSGKTGDNRDRKEKPIDKDDHMIENLGRCLIQEPVFVPMENYRQSSNEGLELDPYEKPMA